MDRAKKKQLYCECLIGRDAICRWLNISKTTFYRLVRRGLPARREGRTWVANCRDLNAWSQTPMPEIVAGILIRRQPDKQP